MKGFRSNRTYFIWNLLYHISGITIFMVTFSGDTGWNNFRPYFQKLRLEYYFLCLFYFASPYSGPEKQDKKSKRDMKSNMPPLYCCYKNIFMVQKLNNNSLFQRKNPRLCNMKIPFNPLYLVDHPIPSHPRYPQLKSMV